MKGLFTGAFALATLLAAPALADHLTPCSSEAPCLNGGSCTVESYCLCLPSFFGARCSRQIFAAVGMSGAQEATPVSSPYNGTSTVIVDTTTMGTTMALEATVINATAAHIHQGPAGVAGPVRFPFTVTNPTPGAPSLYATITATISMTQLELFRTEMYYANIHTAANPPGEIRGQLLPWDACAQDPCMNGGTCFSYGLAPVCGCAEGFGGTMCETRLTCGPVTEDNAAWPEADASSSQLVFGTCASGFSGTPTRLCLASGGAASFSAISNPCVPDCPADPSYGFASWPSTAAMATATGTCAQGYVGTPLRRCSRDGVWETNLQFHCQLARCGPVNIDNAQWPQTNPGSATYGTCNAGFVGRPFRTCLPSGSFGAVQNPCVSASATCPAQTAYAFADWTATTVGQTATGTCISGYSGSPRRTCLPGAWSSSVIGICTRNICPATTDAVHSFPEMKSNTRGYGTCVTGSGRPWRQCLADGTFGPIQNPCA